MKRFVVDTNVLLSFLTDRDPSQRARAAPLFEAAAAGRLDLVLPQIVLVEAAFVLRNVYRLPPTEIAAILAEALALPGVRPAAPALWDLVLQWWPESIAELPDALVAATAIEGGADAVATFDAQFVRRLRKLGIESEW